MKLDAAMLGSSGFERNEHDFYPTPDNCTRAIASLLLGQRFLTPKNTIWEPCCGDDAMARVLRERFDTVVSTDLYPKVDAPVLDFLTGEPDFDFDAIITNPPYGDQQDKFIERCLYYVREHGVAAAMILRHEADCAKERTLRYFDGAEEFAFKLVLTWRPRWIAGSTGSPRHNYAWYGWLPNHVGPAQTYYAFRKDYEG